MTTDTYPQVTRESFRWLSEGKTYKMDDIEDSHLLNIERFMVGLGGQEQNQEYDAAGYQQAYALVRDEIGRRGLQLQVRPHRDARTRLGIPRETGQRTFCLLCGDWLVRDNNGWAHLSDRDHDHEPLPQ